MTSTAGVNGRRVLFVEDDASITRFVGMALEDLDVELVVCADVECAFVALQERPAQLIITDLMLPGLSGFDLLERLQADPGLRGPAKVAIFSAGVTAAALARLETLPVWRILRKPASLAQLHGCVEDALAAPADAAHAGSSASATSSEPASQEEGDADADADADTDAIAIATYFAGNAALFYAYRARCLTQFAHDLAAGDSALAAGDLGALQRLSHSLSTVFRTLGWDADGSVAKRLELAAQAGQSDAARADWLRLRSRLQNA